MTNVFKKIFDVKLIHEYYSSGYADDLVVTPTENCRQLMKNLGMLFRKNSKGFSVLYISDSDGNAVKSFSEKLVFTFTVESVNPYFVNHSGLPIDTGKNKIYYFSNLDSGGNYQTKLTKSDSVKQEDNVSLKPQSFTYAIQSANPSVIVTIKNHKQELIKSESITINNGEAVYSVDLSKYKPGLYELFIDDVSELEFYSGNEAFRSKPFGLIEITREDLSEISYTAEFKKQMTLWRYYVVSKYRTGATKDDLKLYLPKSLPETYFENGLQNLTIVDDKVEIEADSESTNSEGYNVIPIVVDEELPLLEETVSGIELKISTNGSSYELNDLPNPSSRNLTRSLVNGKPEGNKVYSDIYIYI